ncbi:MAG: hypothetical protein IPN84_06545 [Sphingomonadales bacterium]|nr:hypothetical protein [Sphingomonadales bacterium]
MKVVKRLCGVAALCLFLCMILLIDFDPDTPIAPPPVAADARAGEALLQQVEAMRGQDGLYRWDSLKSATRLAAQVSGQSRLALAPPNSKGDGLSVTASRALHWGLWLNATLTVRSGKGAPPVSLTLGSVTLPDGLSHWLLDRALRRARDDFPGLPARDRIIRDVHMQPEGVMAKLDLPVTALTARKAGVSAQALAASTVACQSLKALPAGKPIRLEHWLNTAFAQSVPEAEANSQLLAQMALLASPDQAGRFFPAADDLPAGCGLNDRLLTLQGREDLAHHWLLSASLTARFGAHLSNALGFWKELSDSAPKGSGFSFVDLAADCSGMMWGARLVTAETAAGAARALKQVSADTLLPPQALSLDEGLSEAEFNRRYGSITHLRCARDLRQKMVQR